MMEMRQKVEQVKLYCRIDDDYESIEDYINAAEQYINDSGVNPEKVINDGREELYFLSVKMLVKHWYENRTIVIASGKYDTPIGFNVLINRLQLLSREVTE